jgi:hypothetical protein
MTTRISMSVNPALAGARLVARRSVTIGLMHNTIASGSGADHHPDGGRPAFVSSQAPAVTNPTAIVTYCT